MRLVSSTGLLRHLFRFRAFGFPCEGVAREGLRNDDPRSAEEDLNLQTLVGFCRVLPTPKGSERVSKLRVAKLWFP